MKVFDKVKLLRDCDYYNKSGIYKGRIGTMISAEIRANTIHVVFEDERFLDKNFVWNDDNIYTIKEDIFLEVDIDDLEVVEDGNATDEVILENLPSPDKRWWCKVENGYIMNLLGEKKNKIPYDYNS